jgi:hypothetical protein
MSLSWGENIISKIYPLINNLYDENLVESKSTQNVIKINESVGREVEKKLQERFVPSFFTQDLCEKDSLMGRISTNLFAICEKLCLDKIFECFNKSTKLFSVVSKAERCWLKTLLDNYEDVKLKPENEKEVDFIAKHLAYAVNEPIFNGEVQDRLNKLVALTNVFYVVHGSNHNYVSGRNPQTYFKMIFPEN